MLALVERPKVRVAALWLASVVIFASAYWLCWSVSPDSFILHREFNLTPYGELVGKLLPRSRSKLWEDAKGPQLSGSSDLEEFYRTVVELEKAAANVLEELKQLQDSEKSLDASYRRIIKEHSAKLWANVEKYKEDAVRSVAEEAQRAQEKVNSLEQASAGRPSTALAIVIADARVELAQANLRLAERRAEVSSYILSNLIVFGDKEKAAEMDEVSARLGQVRDGQMSLGKKLAKIRAEAFLKLQDWYRARTPRLGWLEFLYFSSGVSTTTTFGDIVPNSRLVRMVVTIQLVWSVLVVGYFVSLLSTPHTPGG